MDKENIFPIGIFPKTLRSIIEELSRDRQFPLDYLGGAVLWVMSVLIGATSYLRTTLGKTYCNIYMMLIGVPGANKSAPLSWATEYLRRIDDAALTVYERAMAEYEEALTRGEHPEKPIAKRTNLGYSTPEALFKVVGENPKGVGQIVDEIPKAIKDMGRYNHAPDEESYLQLYNGNTITVDRASKQEVLHVTNPYFCLIGTIQNQTFNRVFTRDRVENGLLARFIEIVHYEEGALLWNLTEDLPSDVDTRYEDYVRMMLIRRDEIDINYPHEYTLISDAAETLQVWQNNHEIQIANRGRDIDRAIFRKLQIYVLKFALIIQIIADMDSRQVNSDHIVSNKSAILATVLADYFFRSAKDLARSVSIEKLSKQENAVYDAFPDKFTSAEGLTIANKHGLGKTCYFALLSKIRGILIDQPRRGHYIRRFPQKR